MSTDYQPVRFDLDADYAFRMERSLHLKRSAVRMAPLAYGGLVAAQTSRSALDRFTRKVTRRPERLGAFLRANPDPFLLAAMAGPRAVSNFCGRHSPDQSPATALERIAAKRMSDHFELCHRDPMRGSRLEAKWEGQRRLMRSGFLRTSVDALTATAGAASRAELDTATGRPAVVVPSRDWRPVGVMSSIAPPRFDLRRMSAVMEYPAVTQAPSEKHERQPWRRRRLLLANGQARADQLLERSFVRVPLSTAIYKFRLKRALKRGPDATVRFMSRVAASPRRSAAAMRAGTDPLIVAGVMGPAHVKDLFSGRGFTGAGPLGRLGTALLDRETGRARSGLAARGRKPDHNERFPQGTEGSLGSDDLYQDRRDGFVARVVGLDRSGDSLLETLAPVRTVGEAWQAQQAVYRSGRLEGPEGREQREPVERLMREAQLDRDGGGADEWWKERDLQARAMQEPDLGFMGRILALISLPRVDPGDDVHRWVRTNGPYKLIVVAHGSDGCLPWGVLPRLLLAWVCTEAVRTQRPDLKLGGSVMEFMRHVGLAGHRSGGRLGVHARLQEQTRRLFGSTITVEYTVPGGGPVRQFQSSTGPIAEEQTLWSDFHASERRGSNLVTSVRLGHKVFEEIVTRPVPIDLGVVRAMRRSSLGLDLYLWLTYRGRGVEGSPSA